MHIEVERKKVDFQYGSWMDHAYIENGEYFAVFNEPTGPKTYNLTLRGTRAPRLEWSKTSWQQFIEISLQDLQLDSSANYCRSLELPRPSLTGHMVWSYPHLDTTLLIPASVLQRGLFKLGKYQDLLYRPNSPYELFLPTVSELVDSMRLPRYGRLNVGQGLTSIPRTLLWTTCFPSALRAWASIWRLGQRGIVGLELPRASVIAEIVGETVGNHTFVRMFNTVRIATDESPFPFVQIPAAKWNVLGRWSRQNCRSHWTQTSDPDPFPPFYAPPNSIYPLEAPR